MNPTSANMALGFLVELLDIPPSHYKRAADRYDSLAEWLHREASKVATLSPAVYLQGSFRYGTVIRPLVASETYDLDLVCQVVLPKTGVTQKQVKHLLGDEIKAYAEAFPFKENAEEKHRCWRLNYTDAISFHMDILPCVPEDAHAIERLELAGVPPERAVHAVAITDRRHHSYENPSLDWPSSNPRGFADWFESQARPFARRRIESLVESRAYASIDKVPAYEWTTILQRCIQILKRHRDVMFQESPELKPISMIITTLATLSYQGEPELHQALTGIVERMASHIRPTHPRVPNPLNHAEDFAERWAGDKELERNFRAWHRQAKADLVNLHERIASVPEAVDFMSEKFGVSLTGDMQERLEGRIVGEPGAIMAAVPSVCIGAAPKPWRRHE